MSVRFYMDEHLPNAITETLRLDGVDVLTVQDDRHRRVADPLLLDRATGLGRVFVTQDEDLLHEGALRQRNNIPFAGVIFARQHVGLIGRYIEDLKLIGIADDPDAYANQVTYLPLQMR